jgi:hypothetical protein
MTMMRMSLYLPLLYFVLLLLLLLLLLLCLARLWLLSSRC